MQPYVGIMLAMSALFGFNTAYVCWKSARRQRRDEIPADIKLPPWYRLYRWTLWNAGLHGAIALVTMIAFLMRVYETHFQLAVAMLIATAVFHISPMVMAFAIVLYSTKFGPTAAEVQSTIAEFERGIARIKAYVEDIEVLTDQGVIPPRMMPLLDCVRAQGQVRCASCGKAKRLPTNREADIACGQELTAEEIALGNKEDRTPEEIERLVSTFNAAKLIDRGNVPADSDLKQVIYAMQLYGRGWVVPQRHMAHCEACAREQGLETDPELIPQTEGVADAGAPFDSAEHR